MPEFIITDPTGKEHVVTAPEGATQEQALEFAKSQFGSTQGGAATGNPNIAAQGARANRGDVSLDPIEKIGGAAAAGAAIGTFGSEIMTGLGKVAGGIPQLRGAAPFLDTAGAALKAAGRTAGAIMGGISGAGSETAGQAVELAGGPQWLAEGARFAAGGVSGESAQAARAVLQKYALVPALGLASKFKHEGARVLLEKLNMGAKSISQQEAELLATLAADLRGGAKTDAPLENVGSIMGAEGQRLMSSADTQMIGALRQAGSVGQPSGYGGQPRTLADVGGALQATINKRNKAALTARSAAYTNNENARDTLVSQSENTGKFVTQLPEYAAVVDELKAQLVPGKRSPSVQAGYQKILGELENPDAQITFQALDDVRRKLGDAFRGKPAEGYDAIGATAAEDLYHKVSEIQTQFAGGPAGPQRQLLDRYAADTAGLEQFSSKFGKKATALDQYREGQYATDPSTLPATFFKTRSSIQALHELTGNKTQVSAAALEYADKELAGKTAPQVRDWMTKNYEWLQETGVTRTLIDKYATRLESAERSVANAQEFAKQAAKDANMLVRDKLPAQRAIDLIRSGDTEMWGKIAPTIAKSPQAKVQMVAAVRQVVADAPTEKATATLFERNIRPFLEGSGIAGKAEMDQLSQKLTAIREMKVPEGQKLGLMKRALLESTAGWTATAASRTGFKSMEWAVPQ